MIARVVIAAIAALLVGVPTAGAATACTLGGPAGTFRAFELNLQEPADYLNLSLTAPSSSTSLTRASWHMAAAVAVVNLESLKVVAHRVSNEGVAPRRVLASAPGADPIVVDTPGPGVAIQHNGLLSTAGLPAGRYAVVAFGTDGDPALPNPGWRAELRTSGTRSCISTARGGTFGYDATDFRGGTALVAGGAVVASGMRLQASTAGELVVGLIDATGGPGGEATIGYEHPSSSGTVVNGISAFATRSGGLSWALDATGPLAGVAIAGAAVDFSQPVLSRRATRRRAAR